MRVEQRIGSILVLGSLIIGAAVFTGWFFDNFEQQTREVGTGFSSEARSNTFLAAERFLERLGIDVEAVPGRDLLRNLPLSDDVLVVKGLGPLNAQRREDLHQWLFAGGHLVAEVTEITQLGEAADPQEFVADYGVRLHEIESASHFERITAKIEFGDYPEFAEGAFRARYYLEDVEGDATGNVSADGYDRVLQYRVGQGKLTVASDLDLFTNVHIGDRDHAFVLALLTEPKEGGKVWLLYDSGIPWLGSLLWQHARSAMIAFACLVGVMVWYLGGRFGPLLPTPDPGRRDLLVHLQALARFYWRHGRGSSLIRSTAQRLEWDWLGRHPRLRESGPEARAARIAELSGLSAQQVDDALYSMPADDRGLVEHTALQQRLWKVLDHSGRASSQGDLSLRRRRER